MLPAQLDYRTGQQFRDVLSQDIFKPINLIGLPFYEQVNSAQPSTFFCAEGLGTRLQDCVARS